MSGGEKNGSVVIGGGLALMLGKLGDAFGAMSEQDQQGFVTRMFRQPDLQNRPPNPLRSPVVRKLSQSKVGASTTYAFLDLGFPPAGKIWDVRRVTVWSPTTDSFTSVATAIAEIMVAQSVPPDGASAPPIEHLIAVATAANIPNTATYGRGEVTLVTREHLVVVIKSIGTNSLQAIAQVMEWNEADAQSWASP